MYKQKLTKTFPDIDFEEVESTLYEICFRKDSFIADWS